MSLKVQRTPRRWRAATFGASAVLCVALAVRFNEYGHPALTLLGIALGVFYAIGAVMYWKGYIG